MKDTDPRNQLQISENDQKRKLRRKLEEILGDDLDKVAGGFARATVDPDNGPARKADA